MHYQYHHTGIPTTEKRADERYSARFKMYSSRGDNLHRIQYHRFETGCPLHPLIQTMPHVAFKVDDLNQAIAGKKVLLEPYAPFDGFQVAMVEIDGAPVEYLQTTLTEAEIWQDDHSGSFLYSDDGL